MVLQSARDPVARMPTRGREPVSLSASWTCQASFATKSTKSSSGVDRPDFLVTAQTRLSPCSRQLDPPQCNRCDFTKFCSRATHRVLLPRYWMGTAVFHPWSSRADFLCDLHDQAIYRRKISGKKKRTCFKCQGRKLGAEESAPTSMHTPPSNTRALTDSNALQYGVVASFDDETVHGFIRPMGLDVGEYIEVYRSGLKKQDTVNFAHGAVRTLRSGQRVKSVVGRRYRARQARVLKDRGGR